MKIKYRTLKGTELNLELNAAEARFFKEAYRLFKQKVAYQRFLFFIYYDRRNPLLAKTKGWVTPEVDAHPLFQTVQDLGDRLGIMQGFLLLGPNSSNPEEDTVAISES